MRIPTGPVGLIRLLAPIACLGVVASAQAPKPKPPSCLDAQRVASTAAFEAAVTTEPRSIARHLDLARCYDEQWRFDDAERSIGRALELVRETATSMAAAPAPQSALVTVGADVPAPQKTRDAPVEYPDQAVERSIRGVVVVEARIDRSGRARDARAVESVPGLDAAAVNAVRQWQFKPTLIGGTPADVRSYFFVRFGLPREAMPEDWLDMARFYCGRGLPAHAIPLLDAALARERRDSERFADTRRVGARGPGTIQEPVKMRDIPPVYPAGAVQKRISGMVIIEAMIDRFGDVGRARVVRSVPMLDAAAIDAVMQWRYTPAKVDGTAVPVVMTVTVNFALR